MDKPKQLIIGAFTVGTLLVSTMAASYGESNPVEPLVVTTILAAGDIGDCARTTDTATKKLLDANPHDVVITLGDNVYPSGTLSKFNQCYGPTWGTHLADTKPAPGNHDYINLPTASGYFDYFGSKAGPDRRGWYSYNKGNWHIVSLNSERPTAAQVDWLKADLARNNSPCTMAYWHHPRYEKTDKGDDPSVEPFWAALDADNAELIINAHAHNYQRFFPIRGMTQIISGTGGGGSPLDAMVPDSRRAAGNGATYGVLKLTLRDNSWSSKFLPVAGKTYTDSGSGTCS